MRRAKRRTSLSLPAHVEACVGVWVIFRTIHIIWSALQWCLFASFYYLWKGKILLDCSVSSFYSGFIHKVVSGIPTVKNVGFQWRIGNFSWIFIALYSTNSLCYLLFKGDLLCSSPCFYSLTLPECLCMSHSSKLAYLLIMGLGAISGLKQAFLVLSV